MQDAKGLRNVRAAHAFDYLDGVTVISQNELYRYADGVQLEGGWVYKEKLRPGQKYANVSVVFDLPFQGLEATAAFAHGKEHFRESRLHDYNEAQVVNLLTHLILYYLRTATRGSKVVFLFYVGKRTSLKLLEVVEPFLQSFGLSFEKNTTSGTRLGALCEAGRTMEFVCHYGWLNAQIFEGAEKIVGFSWNGGLNPAYRSGDFLIPTQFIDIANGQKFSTLFVDKKYAIENDLQVHLKSFLATQDAHLVDRINAMYRSENPLKQQHRATLLTEQDFYQNVTMLGTWDILEPSRWPQDVVIPS